MSTIPPTTPAQMLAKYMAAEAAILEGKSIQFNGRTLTMENLSEVRKGRMEWETRTNAEITPARPRFGGIGFSVARFD